MTHEFDRAHRTRSRSLSSSASSFAEISSLFFSAFLSELCAFALRFLLIWLRLCRAVSSVDGSLDPPAVRRYPNTCRGTPPLEPSNYSHGYTPTEHGTRPRVHNIFVPNPNSKTPPPLEPLEVSYGCTPIFRLTSVEAI